MNDICDGCVVTRGVGYCLTHVIENGENCPCVNCLIKVMCSRACEDRINYSKKSITAARKEERP